MNKRIVFEDGPDGELLSFAVPAEITTLGVSTVVQTPRVRDGAYFPRAAGYRNYFVETPALVHADQYFAHLTQTLKKKEDSATTQMKRGTVLPLTLSFALI
jgi:hypothetical protein